jgi:hypothetical protein
MRRDYTSVNRRMSASRIWVPSPDRRFVAADECQGKASVNGARGRLSVFGMVVVLVFTLAYLSVVKAPLWFEWIGGGRDFLPGREFVFPIFYLKNVGIAVGILAEFADLVRVMIWEARHPGKRRPKTPQAIISLFMLAFGGAATCVLIGVFALGFWIVGLTGAVPPVHWGRAPVPPRSLEATLVSVDLPHAAHTGFWKRFFGKGNAEGMGFRRDANYLPELVCRPAQHRSQRIASTFRRLPPAGMNGPCLKREHCADHLVCLGEAWLLDEPGLCVPPVGVRGVCFHTNYCQPGLRCSMYGECKITESAARLDRPLPREMLVPRPT